MHSRRLVLLIAGASASIGALARQVVLSAPDVQEPFTRTGPSQYVNHFIGTTAGGHVFPGATLPWGSVKAGADCDSRENQAGYVADGSDIRGFSPLHDDGTGGAPSLGQFKLMPMYCVGGTGGGQCDAQEGRRQKQRVEGSQDASPGYFKLGLVNDVTVEIAASHHAALYKFTFDKFKEGGDEKPVIAFDLSNDLLKSFSQGLIHLEHENGAVRVSGWGEFRPSFGGGNYKAYYCLDIPQVTGAAFWIASTVGAVNGSVSIPIAIARVEAGTIAEISSSHLASSGSTAYARVGISWSSIDNACSYAETEIPAIDAAQFTATREAATKIWDDTLGAVELDMSGVSEERKVLFWSSLYRTYISPTNVSGDNPLWDSDEPYWDSFYCIWDSFRVVHPLYAITQRAAQAEVVRALIDIYRYLGFLPDCRMSTNKGFTQGGSNADAVLTDSYVKGIREGINWKDGLAAMIKDAEVTPPDWTFEGRGGIEARKKLRYVPMDDDTPRGIRGRSASRTLEYSFNDFNIALLANALGDTKSAKHYAKVSSDWQNLWNPNTIDAGFKGFIQPRYKNGSFVEVHPQHCSPVMNPDSCYLNDHGGEFYETSSWQYSFYAPHDMATLVHLMGGRKKFTQRLDTLLSDAGYHDIGNEPGFMHAYLYNYAGAPAKTVDHVLGMLEANFTTEIDGLPGNDDSGSMGGFVVFSCFGFYPVAGTSVYLLSTPLFKELRFPSSVSGKQAVISTVNFDGAVRNKYIQSATLNGQPFTKNWFSHHELFETGGVLELTLGHKPSTWGTGNDDVPPSFSVTKSLAPFS